MRIAEIDIITNQVTQFFTTDRLRGLQPPEGKLLVVLDSQIRLKGVSEETLLTYVYDPDTGRLNPPAPVYSLDELKAQKRALISQAFDTAVSQGRFDSSLGFPMDARRSATKNDLQNMREVLSLMQDLGLPSVAVTDADDKEQAGITQEQLQALIVEIRNYGMGLFEYKRQLVAQLEAAQTAEEIAAVSW